MEQHPWPEAGPEFVAWWRDATAEDQLAWITHAAALVRDGHNAAQWLACNILYLQDQPTGNLDAYPGPPRRHDPFSSWWDAPTLADQLDGLQGRYGTYLRSQRP